MIKPVWRKSLWIFATFALDIAAALLSVRFEVPVPFIFLIVLTTTLFVIIFRILYKIETLSAPSAEILTDPETALNTALQMQKHAKKYIGAVWSLAPLDEHLKNYFQDVMGTAFTIRLIDSTYVKISDVLSHIELCWENIKKKTYEIYFVKNTGFEVLIVDHKEAAIFLYSTPAFGCSFIRHSDLGFITAVDGMLQGFKKEATPFPSQSFDSQFDKESIEEWLKTTIYKKA